MDSAVEDGALTGRLSVCRCFHSLGLTQTNCRFETSTGRSVATLSRFAMVLSILFPCCCRFPSHSFVAPLFAGTGFSFPGRMVLSVPTFSVAIHCRRLDQSYSIAIIIIHCVHIPLLKGRGQNHQNEWQTAADRNRDANQERDGTTRQGPIGVAIARGWCWNDLGWNLRRQ